jgi:hypothetical protein
MLGRAPIISSPVPAQQKAQKKEEEEETTPSSFFFFVSFSSDLLWSLVMALLI